MKGTSRCSLGASTPCGHTPPRAPIEASLSRYSLATLSPSACYQVRLLKTSGADIECKMDWGKTAVDYARDHGHADIMAILNDEEGIDPKLRKK